VQIPTSSGQAVLIVLVNFAAAIMYSIVVATASAAVAMWSVNSDMIPPGFWTIFLLCLLVPYVLAGPKDFVVGSACLAAGSGVVYALSIFNQDSAAFKLFVDLGLPLNLTVRVLIGLLLFGSILGTWLFLMKWQYPEIDQV